MNAPEGGILLQQPVIPLAAITVSKTNPRKSFDQAKLDELTESVRLKGVINPILVRPTDGGYEVVAGERRFKAAKAAGLAEIPATVKPLSDAEALELQVIENNQREDLHPLEEAEGFEALLKCKHADGSRYTVDDVAEKIGKSKSYVYKKMKLCDCCKDVRQAFYDGKIDFSKALLLAQIHGEKLQRQALEEITRPWIAGEPMTFRNAHHHVQQTYMLALEKAPFSTKDEKLVAKAGPCTTCPKRTGNAPELFADVKAGDMCTDPGCFSSKREAHHNAERQAAIAAGRTVIGGKEAKKIKPYQHSELQGGYVSTEQRCWDDSKNRTYGEIVGTKAEPALLDDPHAKGAFVKMFKLADIKEFLPKSPSKNPAASRSSPRRVSPIAPRIDKDEIFRERLFIALAPKLPTVLGKEELRLIANDLLQSADLEVQVVANVFIPPKDGKERQNHEAFKAIEAAAEKMDAPQLARLVTALLVSRDVPFCHGKPERLLAAAKRARVDPEKVKKALADEDKAAAAAKKKVEPKPTKKPTPKKKAKKR
jgi:ParB/RepB/Spo0J family partition protein